MFSGFPHTRPAVGAIALAVLVAAGGVGIVRAESESSAEGARYICRGLHFVRQCVYIQVAYGTSWGLRVDSDHPVIDAIAHNPSTNLFKARNAKTKKSCLIEHGRSNLEFDYRIVAHPLDADDDRLPIVQK